MSDIEWIFVDTATKTPTPRGSSASPFEHYSAGVNPNVNTPFGPHTDWMFLPVLRADKPEVNPVLERLDYYETTGHDGKTCPGKHIDPDWVIGWDVLPQEVDAAKSIKLRELSSDQATAIEGGYVVGQYVFPFSEHFFRLLSDRHYWMGLAIAAGTISSGQQITFSDKNDKEVAVTVSQIETHFIAYGVQFIQIEEKAVQARSNIEAATTIAAVDAVTWTF